MGSNCTNGAETSKGAAEFNLTAAQAWDWAQASNLAGTNDQEAAGLENRARQLRAEARAIVGSIVRAIATAHGLHDLDLPRVSIGKDATGRPLVLHVAALEPAVTPAPARPSAPPFTAEERETLLAMAAASRGQALPPAAPAPTGPEPVEPEKQPAEPVERPAEKEPKREREKKR